MEATEVAACQQYNLDGQTQDVCAACNVQCCGG